MADEKSLPNLEHSLATPSEKVTCESSNSDNLGTQNVINTIDKEILINLNQLSIGTVISQSRYSVVYQGLYKSRPVAIKVIQPERSSDVSPDRKEKFEREITLLSRVKHDNIVKFIGASKEPTLILVTELMKGDTLEKYLWSIRPRRPDLKRSLSFALGISRAMEYLHAIGIIHRDLKPSNLLLTEDKRKVKLADFGLAREEAETEMTAEAGTYRWMAPELIVIEPVNHVVKKHYNHKVDVYSFSMVLWELLTNETPFKGRSNIMAAYDTCKKVRPSTADIPKEIEPLISSCWSEDPADRPEFEKISEFLVNTLGDEAITLNLSERELPANAEITTYPDTSGWMDDGAESKKKKKSKSWSCCLSNRKRDDH